MYSDKDINTIISSITKDNINLRQRVIANFAEDKLEDVGELFFANLLREEKDAICKWYEIIALGKLKAKKSIPLLIDILTEEDVVFETGSSLHSAVALSLGRIGEDSLSYIYPLLNSSSIETKIAAMDSIGEVASPSSLPVIKKVFYESYSTVTTYAGMALTKIGKDALPLIEDLSGEVSPDILYVLIDSLAGINATEEVYNLMLDICKRYPVIAKKAFSLNSKNIGLFKKALQLTNKTDDTVLSLKEFVLSGIE